MAKKTPRSVAKSSVRDTKILACVNLKGGVGKTTVAVNFAAHCAINGLKTLLVDLDPQTNATFSCMTVDDWEQHSTKKGTVADLLGVRRHNSAEGGAKSLKSVLVKNVFGISKLHLVPSHLDLFTVDLDLAGVTAREKLLKRALKSTIGNYDIIVCDCPPNLTIPTQNALALSTHYVVPISPDFLSALGVGLLLSRVEELTAALDRELEHIGIVISRVGRNATHRDQIISGLRLKFGNLVFADELTERVAVSKAAASNKPVVHLSDGDATREFTAVSSAILKRMGITA